VQNKIVQYIIIGFVFLFFALEAFTIPILHSFIEFISQTKYSELDSVIGSVGALSYGVIALLLLCINLLFSLYFWFYKRKVLAVYCLKLILSQLLGITVAVSVSVGI
jgi:hypothetical protein